MAETRTLHTSALFRVLDSRCQAARSGPSAVRGDEPPHLALLRRGAFGYHVGPRAFVGDPCTALVHLAPVEYRVSHPADCGDDSTVIVLAPELIEELWPGCSPRRPELGVTAAAWRWHTELLRTVRSPPADALELDECVMALLGALRGDAPGERAPGPAARRRRVLARVRALLAERVAENVELATIAAEVGCSPFALMRLFRSETGQTLRGYRRRLRVFLAMDRLATDEDAELAALAVELGFSHHSHFTATFHQVVGMSPSAFRAERVNRRARARS